MSSLHSMKERLCGSSMARCSGTVGILAKRQGRQMFLINIDILGRSVGLKICAEDVELA